MNETKIVKFPYYASNVKVKKPLGVVSLNQLLNLIKKPTDNLSKVCSAIREASANNNLALKSRLKTHLFFVTPSVTTDMEGRSYSNITGFTGYLPLDFDKVENATELRDELFYTHDFIIASWLSVSGRGVRAIVKIPIASSVDEFKEYYWGLANNVMSYYKGLDSATSNAVLPLFFSDDPDIKMRHHEKTNTWTKKGTKPVPVHHTPSSIPMKLNAKRLNKYYNYTVNNVCNAINSINDNGHPQVRAAAYTLGGRVAAGYIDYSEALDLISNLIKSNSYLSKGTNGYLKTANEMLNQGVDSPLYFQ